ncbi:NAD-P-binding protein [Trametes versicolor FP-101664 SS1]|uniref:NAD-P-binding protein n=1 Tax=Trametes versicolor (strain FP-101664) TaxID=717944 RepID=UPI0004622067|nr:NAD-P-binding protein [Trametes versicolor FP-101664 SS1]EIW57123.1 NAD-P-binding protein [Trametes versicolor FP-101664 SS1]
MTVSYAVVGASRGIGLEYVRQLATRPDTIVFAIVRNKKGSFHLTAAIANFKNVHVFEADVVDHASLERAAKEVAAISGGKLDVLIHNAGRMSGQAVWMGFKDYPNMDALDADCIEAYKINALGVVHGIAAFLPLLRAGPTKKIAVLGTDGAIPNTVYALGLPDLCAYSMSKAASMLATAKWALQLKDEGFIVVTLAPGLVDTTDTVGTSGTRIVPSARFLGGTFLTV